MKKVVLFLLALLILSGCTLGMGSEKGEPAEPTLLDAFDLIDGELVPKEKKSTTVHYTLDGKDITFDFEYAESEGSIVPLTFGGVPELNISYYVRPIPNNTKECIIQIGEVYTEKDTEVSSDKLLNLESGEISTLFDETNQEELVKEFFASSQNESVMYWVTVIAMNPSGNKLLFSSDRKDLYWIKDLVTKTETPIKVSGISYLGWKNDHEIFFKNDRAIVSINIDNLEVTKILDESTHPGWVDYSNYIIHGTYDSLLITDLLTMKEYSYGECKRRLHSIYRSPDNQKVLLTFSGFDPENSPGFVVYNLTDNSKKEFLASDFDNYILTTGCFIDNNTLLIKGYSPYDQGPDSKYKSYIVKLK